MLKELKLKFGEYTFYTPLDTPGVTLIGGDTGVGKSYIWQQIWEMVSNKNFKYPCYCINYDSRGFVPVMLNSTDGLFVLDDFELLLDVFPDIRNFINTLYLTKVQILIFGRDTYGLRVSRDYMFDMVLKGKHIGVRHNFGKREEYFGGD